MSDLDPVYVVAHDETVAKIHTRNASLGVTFSAEFIFRNRKDAEMKALRENIRSLECQTFESFRSQDQFYVWEVFFDVELAGV